MTWIVNPGNEHAYRLVWCRFWVRCESLAAAQGAHLVTINDAEEQMWLVQTFGESEWFWIGLTDRDAEGDWQWSSGEPVVYTNWTAEEPNDMWDCEDYAIMNWGPGGQWNDLGSCLPEWKLMNWAIIERAP